MAQNRQWSRLINIIPTKIYKLRSSNHNYSLLHHACKYQPPIRVIKEIMKASPDLGYINNSDGHSPLHIAAQFGASPELIHFFCLVYPDTAELQDFKGRTPLQLACKSYIKYYRVTPSRTAQEALLSTVKILVRTSPTTVNLEDLDGMSASDYMLDTNTDWNILAVIQNASVREWERRRALLEKTKIETLSQDKYQGQRSSLPQEITVTSRKETPVKNSNKARSA